MKKSILLALALFAWISLGAQNLEVTYLAMVRKTLPDEARKDFIDKGLRDQLKQNEEPEPCEYKMVISNKESSFTYVEKINNDQDPNANVIRVAPAGFGTIYKNLSDSTRRENHNVYGKKYFSLDPLKKMDWKISKEKTEILGFKVRKATAEDSTAIYTVWYAPKLPISNGPSDYGGLPGLILEAEKSSKKMIYTERFIAESIEELDKKPKIIKPDEGAQISIKDIGAIWNEANEKRNQMLRGSEGVDKD